MHCTCCHRELTGGLDTYGDRDMPMCQHCHLTWLRGPQTARLENYCVFSYTDGTFECRLIDEYQAVKDALGAARPAGGQQE